MIRPDLFTPAAAQRFASGDDPWDQIRSDVLSWFADVYGWPPTSQEQVDYHAFMEMVGTARQEKS